MIAQHRMIRSAHRPRIGYPLRVSLSSYTFQLVIIHRRTISLEHSFAREAEACTNDRATIRFRLKLKTSIEREREEKGLKRGEKTKGKKW